MQAGGSDIRDATEGIVTFNQRVTDALAGTGEEAKKFFQDLGQGPGNFVGLDSADRFFALIDALKQVPDPARRVQLLLKAVGEDTGKNLIPLLSMSATQVRELGDAMQSSASDIDAARTASRAQTLAVAQLGRVWREVATAIAPSIKEFSEVIQRNVGPVVEWVRENREAVAMALKVATALTVAGVAFVAVGTAAGAVASAIGGFFSVLALVKGALLAVISPWGLLTAAVAGLTYLFVTQTETGQKWFASLKAGFQEVAGIAMESWGGIVAAVKKGDLSLAGEIALTTLELLWEKALGRMTELWVSFKTPFINGWHELTDGVGPILTEMWSLAKEAFANIQEAATYAFDAIGERVSSVVDLIVAGWDEIKDSVMGVVEFLAPVLAPLLAPFLALADLVQQAWDGLSSNIAETLNNFSSWVEKSFVRASAAVTNSFAKMGSAALSFAITALEALDSVDPTDSLKGTIEWAKAARAALDATVVDPAGEIAAIEAKRKLLEDQLRAEREKAKAARDEARADDAAEADAKAAALEAKLKDLIAKAKEPKAVAPDFGGGGDFGAASSAAMISGSRGSFSSAASAQRFGADKIAVQQLNVAKKQLDVMTDVKGACIGIANGLKFK